MYKIGDYVVCPGHGVGQVCNIEDREMESHTTSYYTIKILSNGMKVMIPTDSKDGVRDLVTIQDIQDVYGLLNNHEVEVDNSTWNRRHRDYLQKIKTGSLLEIADVLRSLYLLKHTKSLSFGERKMLEQCKDLLVKEIALSGKKGEKEVSSEIDACFQ